ncbi:MAG TPA: protein translocase subunit SecF [Rhizomicrobium sp.]|jgi:preprotein translocase SecF subunit
MALLRFLPEDTKIDFVGVRYWAFAIDGLLLLISIVSLVWHGFNLGIDFTGGNQLEYKSTQTITENTTSTIRASLDKLGLADKTLQAVGGGLGGGQCDTPANSCIQIRIPPNASGSNNAIVPLITQALGPTFHLRSNDTVGPKVSQELFSDGVKATLIAIFLIAIYVAFRFEWQYGIGAAVATGHDVFVTAGLFSVFHLDFTLTSVAALLTLAGYSINDTVVVFDRIRENRRKYKRMPLAELINLSTNQMLTRTILTSAATAISILPLLIWGGDALFDFTAAILFGIVVGTFSSTYVAAALLLYLPAPAGTVGTGDEKAVTSAS